MLAVLIAAATLQAPLSRDAFNRQCEKLERGMTPAEVESLLGKPDDILTKADSRIRIWQDDYIWCYGTDGHLSMPTLGFVRFDGGKVESSGSLKWPIPNLPGDRELRRGLRAIYLTPSRINRWVRYDPLWAIHAATYLRSLSKEEAIAVLVAAERLDGALEEDNSSRFIQLAPLVFDGPMPLPQVGVLSNYPSKDSPEWPTFPLRIVDDVPFLFAHVVMLGGQGENFERYAKRAGKHWKIRRGKLAPPRDPFLAFEHAMRVFVDREPKPNFQFSPKYGDHFANILALVREVIPVPKDEVDWLSAEDYAKYHEAFLKAGGHWDARLRRYVRGDGTWTP